MAEGIGYNDMMRMQSEAVQRVREMQRRAQSAVQKANAQRTGRAQEQPEHKGESFKSNPPLHNARATALPLDYVSNQPASATSQPRVAPQAERSAPPAPEKENRTNPPPLFSGDTDRLLVITLMLLLSQEEADELLLMALGYLIM